MFNKTLTKVLAEYFNYKNVFSVEKAAEFPENTRINEYSIKLEKSKQPPFGPIYSLGPIKLEILNTYIEINLANGFICPFKSPTKASILFNRKPNKSFRLCVDYRDLNNITIKN